MAAVDTVDAVVDFVGNTVRLDHPRDAHWHHWMPLTGVNRTNSIDVIDGVPHFVTDGPTRDIRVMPHGRGLVWII